MSNTLVGMVLVCSAVLTCVFPRGSLAQDICGWLRAGLESSERGFSDIHGKFSSLTRRYRSTLALDGFEKCFVELRGKSSELSCEEWLSGSDRERAYSDFYEYADAAARCLGKDLQLEGPDIKTDAGLHRAYVHTPTSAKVIFSVFLDPDEGDGDGELYGVFVVISTRDPR